MFTHTMNQSRQYLHWMQKYILILELNIVSENNLHKLTSNRNKIILWFLFVTIFFFQKRNAVQYFKLYKFI